MNLMSGGSLGVRRSGGVDARERFLSQASFQELFERAVRMMRGGGGLSIYIESTWTGNIRWARNEVITSGDVTDHVIQVTRDIRGAFGGAVTNRTDDAALRVCLAEAEHRVHLGAPDDSLSPFRASERYDTRNLWSDATFGLDAVARAEIQRQLVSPARQAGLLSAGYLEVKATGNGVMNTEGMSTYVPATRAEFSVTVRNAKGTGSGWAGKDHLDWRHIDAEQLAAVAVDKCQRSADPVALEPGRYTVILESQAVADLMYPLVHSLIRRYAERGIGPWAYHSEDEVPPDIFFGEDPTLAADKRRRFTMGGGRSKINLKVLDERVTIGADPADPDMPFVPFDHTGDPCRPVTWFDKGYLRQLSYDRRDALELLNRSDPLINTDAFRMAGGTSTIPDMIASTERGLLVTRFVNVRLVDYTSLLHTGTTADGLWLIEHGKIAGPVKNFRFRESPLYIFNNLEALGPAERVFMEHPTIVPSAKVRDFSMTSLADAV